MTENEKELRNALVSALMLGHRDPSCTLDAKSESQRLRDEADFLDAVQAERKRLWAIARKYPST